MSNCAVRLSVSPNIQCRVSVLDNKQKNPTTRLFRNTSPANPLWDGNSSCRLSGTITSNTDKHASCPVTALQLMQWICTNGSRWGKGTADTRVQLTVQLPVLQRKESSSLPQSCIAPTMLRQRGAKPVAIKLLKTSDSKKDHLHGTALLYQELDSRLFDESHTLKAICPGL